MRLRKKNLKKVDGYELSIYCAFYSTRWPLSYPKCSVSCWLEPGCSKKNKFKLLEPVKRSTLTDGD
jgi:hypothetical protein